MNTSKQNQPAQYKSPLCSLTLTRNGYELHLNTESGQVVALKPFKADQSGLVAAVSLIAEIEAGKFWLLGTVAPQPTQQAPQPQRLAAPIAQPVTVEAIAAPVVDVQPTQAPQSTQPNAGGFQFGQKNKAPSFKRN